MNQGVFVRWKIERSAACRQNDRTLVICLVEVIYVFFELRGSKPLIRQQESYD